MRLFKNIFIFFLIGIPIMVLVLVANEYFHLGITDDDVDIFLSPFLTFLFFWIASKELRKSFYGQFIKVKAFDRVILLPILLAIIELALAYLYVYFPVFSGNEPISLGASQYRTHTELTTAGEFLLLGVIGPFSEEFLFRFLLLFFLPQMMLSVFFPKEAFVSKKNENKKLPKPYIVLSNLANRLHYRAYELKDKRIISAWVILVSFLFSMVHGPDMYSFAIYFLPGILYSFVYLKYGFLASWICHGASNSMSNMMNSIFISFLN